MIDVQTLMINLVIVEGLLAILMLLGGHFQKNYPGFTIWSMSLFCLALSNTFLILRGIIPDIISVLLGILPLLLSQLLMAESLHRFYTDTPMIRWYYLILLPVAALLIYFTLVIDDLEIRSPIIAVASICIVLIILHIIRNKAPKGNIPSRYIFTGFFIFAIFMAVRGIEWLFHPTGRSIFETTAFNIGLYVVGIIAILMITIMFLFLHFNRFADDLKQSHATTSRLLDDLDWKNRELDRMVQDRTTRISNLLIQKDQFIIQIAHDLRTPLTPLVALVPLLKKRNQDKESVELFEILEKNVNYLRDITEHIIKLATLNSQNSITDFQERDLSGLIQDAIDINSFPIKYGNITVEAQIPSHIKVFVSKVFGVTIFSNLINNAVKYNVRSGRITITGNEEDANVSIIIADTGVGMNDETIEKIWDEFYICDTSRSDPVSKGLGLNMVKKIVALHGGDISVSSPGPGKGSVFVVRLPRFNSDRCRIPGAE